MNASQNGNRENSCANDQFRAIEFLVFMDDSLIESQMFHGGREAEYPAAIEARINQFTDGGWIPESASRPTH